MLYDPARQPDPAQWLALDQQERIQLAEAHHIAAKIALPDARLHACFHAIVENQIAEGLDSVVRAMARLTTSAARRLFNILAARLRKTGPRDYSSFKLGLFKIPSEDSRHVERGLRHEGSDDPVDNSLMLKLIRDNISMWKKPE